jgi:hypothetical protein
MKKIQTYRVKYKNLWICVVLQDFGFASNLALHIYKSKRAQQDWYNNRKNRRARRAAQAHNMADTQCLAICARMIRLVLEYTPGPVFAYPQDKNREPLLRYLERWGFEKSSDNIWVRVN